MSDSSHSDSPHSDSPHYDLRLRDQTDPTELKIRGDTRLDRVELRDDPIDPLLNLFSPVSLADALASNEWNLEEEIAIVAEIAKGLNPKATPSHQLAAADYLRRRAHEVLKLSGHIGVKQAKLEGVDSSGNQITLTTKAHTLSASTDKALAALSQPVNGFSLDPNKGLLTYEIVSGGPSENDNESDGSREPDEPQPFIEAYGDEGVRGDGDDEISESSESTPEGQ